MKKIIFLFLIFNFSFAIDYFSEDSLLKFADSLYNEADYKGALLEYRRILTIDKRKTLESKIYFKIALCYEKLKDYKNAISNYEKAVNENEFVGFKIALNQTRLKDFFSSITTLKTYNKEIIFDKNGVLYTLNLVSISNYTLAKEMLVKESVFEQVYYQNMTNKLGNLIKSYEGFQPKNPYLAAFYSTILPGSGKFYAERWFDGLFSLSFIASTAIFATLYFMNNGIESWQGWVLTGTGVVFYIGDIYGAFKAAENYNKTKLSSLEKQKEELLNEISD
ncbi:MAG: tetratricopeptide repeat protein [Brevinematales bacterium]|nr:tetratricopeptide repeat protein [Brevinematales bacterium]